MKQQRRRPIIFFSSTDQTSFSFFKKQIIIIIIIVIGQTASLISSAIYLLTRSKINHLHHRVCTKLIFDGQGRSHIDMISIIIIDSNVDYAIEKKRNERRLTHMYTYICMFMCIYTCYDWMINKYVHVNRWERES
jgi:hypothetical protein